MTLDMEQLLELRQVGQDVFVNVQEPWLPPGADFIYGGTMVAHCILAAWATVQVDCSVTSLRSTFVEGGRPGIPIIYKVCTLGPDASLPLRTVRALQNGRCIFVAAVRFQIPPHRDSGSSYISVPSDTSAVHRVKGGGGTAMCPYVCSDLEALPNSSPSEHDMVITQRVRTSRPMTVSDPVIHAAALAYMSDNYLLPTATRVHGIRWQRDPETLPPTLAASDRKALHNGVQLMVSLDHTILFHSIPKALRADEWIRSEMRSPWAGQGRALVSQRMYSANGHLAATVFQEGVLRMNQSGDPKL